MLQSFKCEANTANKIDILKLVSRRAGKRTQRKSERTKYTYAVNGSPTTCEFSYANFDHGDCFAVVRVALIHLYVRWILMSNKS